MAIGDDVELSSRFQFLLGTLITQRWNMGSYVWEKFQFLLGTLITQVSIGNIYVFMLFQFCSFAYTLSLIHGGMLQISDHKKQW
jgi:hypothetical protein